MLSNSVLLQDAKTLLVRFRQLLHSSVLHVSQVWDVFKPSKSELCEMTIYGTRISTEQHFGCLGFGAPNNEVGQLKSQHCFHNATIYFYYSLQYPLSYLVLTTLVSPAPSSFSTCSLCISPIFPLPLQYETPTQKKFNCKTRRFYTFFTAHPSFHAGFLFFISALGSGKEKRIRRGRKGGKNGCFPSNMWPLLSSQLKIIWAYRPVDGWRKPPSPVSGG